MTDPGVKLVEQSGARIHGANPIPVRVPTLAGGGLLQVTTTLKEVLTLLDQLLDTMAEHGLVKKV